MSEEQTNVAQETATENQTQETNTEVKVETPKQNTFTQEQLELTWKYTNKPTVMFDGDEIGRAHV